MDTFICDKCKQLFNGASGSMDSCPYCESKYFIWVTYKGRTKKEVDELLKKVSFGGENKNLSDNRLSSGPSYKGK